MNRINLYPGRFFLGSQVIIIFVLVLSGCAFDELPEPYPGTLPQMHPSHDRHDIHAIHEDSILWGDGRIVRNPIHDMREENCRSLNTLF
jgi:hypothetical protein